MTNREYLNQLDNNDFAIEMAMAFNDIELDCREKDCNECNVHYCGLEQLIEWLGKEREGAGGSV